MSLGRSRALLVLGVMGLIAIIAVVWTITRDSQDDSDKAGNKCVTAAMATKVPEPAEARVRVLNATDRAGLAGTTGDQLKARGFTVVEVGNSKDVLTASAEVRYGPKAVGAGHLVRANVPGSQAVPLTEGDDVVTLIIGPGFSKLTPTGEVQNTLKTLGDPVKPKITCE